ncbi:MAG TPA: hypothetical protein PLD25_13905 [Chloroflexota bacterium]|nr:hypothetical protein [Chloroflexota bacterium]
MRIGTAVSVAKIAVGVAVSNGRVAITVTPSPARVWGEGVGSGTAVQPTEIDITRQTMAKSCLVFISPPGYF